MPGNYIQKFVIRIKLQVKMIDQHDKVFLKLCYLSWCVITGMTSVVFSSNPII